VETMYLVMIWIPLTLQRRQRRGEKAFQGGANGAWPQRRRSMRRACAAFAVCGLARPRDQVAGGLPCHARQHSARRAPWGRACAAGSGASCRPQQGRFLRPPLRPSIADPAAARALAAPRAGAVTTAGCRRLLPATTRQRIDDIEQPFLIRRAQRRAASKRIAIFVHFRHRVGFAASDCAQNRFPFRATGVVPGSRSMHLAAVIAGRRQGRGRADWPDQAGNVMAFGMAVAIRSHSGETSNGRDVRISCRFRNAPAQAWP
jgi:hypothetical protein